MKAFSKLRADRLILALVCSSCAAALTLPAEAAANERDDDQQAGAAASIRDAQAALQASNPQLDAVAAASAGGDIVVTANRREQRLQDVGITVSVLTAEDIITKGITSTADLARTIPSFSAADSSLNTPIYSIRGIGLNESSLGANATVAISVDQVPLPYAAMTTGTVLDLQRVEVLKGPQGTLYGLNATGGAINYIAARPTDKFTAGVTASFGRFDTFIGEGFVSGPLTDTLSVRLAANTQQSGNWQKSYTRDDSLGAVHKVSGRLLLAWKPTPAVHVDLILDGWKNTSDSVAAQATAFRIQSPANVGLITALLAQPLAPADARAANWDPGHDYAKDDSFLQAAFKVSVDLANQLSLQTISSYAFFRQHDYIDRDGLPLTNYHVTLDGHIGSVYQEARLIYASSNLNLSAGGNYRNDKIVDDQITETVVSTISVAAGRPIPYNGIQTHQNIETYAAFADGEYKIVPKLSLVAGVRYTRDRRDFYGSTVDTGNGLSAAAFTVVMNAQRGRFGLPPLPAILPGGSVTLASGTFVPGFQSLTLDQQNVAFHGGLNYKLDKDALLYASYSRGYKAGSFPTLGAIFAVVLQPAVQERVDAYETGFKVGLFDNTVHLNGAGFFYDYNNKQFRGRIIDPVLGSLSKLVNIPRSEVYGAELEATWRPIAGLSFNGAVTYVNSKILDFTNVNLFGVLQNFRGSQLNYTPNWSVNFSPEYRSRLNDKLDYVLGGDLIYRSSTSAFIGNDPDLYVKAYTTLDLRAGIDAQDNRWSATAYAYNVTNQYYWTSVNRGSDTIFRYAAMPVTYGVRVSYRY